MHLIRNSCNGICGGKRRDCGLTVIVGLRVLVAEMADVQGASGKYFVQTLCANGYAQSKKLPARRPGTGWNGWHGERGN